MQWFIPISSNPICLIPFRLTKLTHVPFRLKYIVGTTEMFIGNKMAKSEAEKCYLVTNTGKLQAGHLQVPKTFL